MNGITLDAGGLISVERGERTTELLIKEARRQGLEIVIPAAVLAQVWRDGSRQARLASLLASGDVTVIPLDELFARRAGQLCGAKRTSDVVDASVVVCARAFKHAVVTSDAGGLRRLDPSLEIIEV